MPLDDPTLNNPRNPSYPSFMPLSRGVALLGMFPGDIQSKRQSLTNYLSLDPSDLVQMQWLNRVTDLYLEDEALNQTIQLRKQNENPKPC